MIMTETLEEAAIRLVPNRTLKSPFGTPYEITPNRERNTFIKGAKWQAKRMYSEEEVYDLFAQWNIYKQGFPRIDEDEIPNGFMSFNQWFEQFKKK